MTKGTRKFFFGYSSVRLSDGNATGAATLKLKPKNAYELLGLRKPIAGGAGKP